ncbi:MAG: dTDP-4-dehydrorhamnose 3,5-epimerase [Magnetospirillum sp.]|nr:dTDP-4-dehydrorhamnose 3,5-epimerase [Magnetospirillum sp.]
MRVVPLELPGAVVVEPEPISDHRGHFARLFCVDELAALGLETAKLQESISFNRRAGTLRGMHWQEPPDAEAKYVRCTAGAIYDVILDLRRQSPTYLRWEAVELSAANYRTLYIPKGFAHGFLTLEDATEVHYSMTHRYTPEAARGARYDDPAFRILWPVARPVVISDKDLSYPAYSTERSGA